ncbi:phosphoribosyltransferase family protein [Phytomonospora sp. NPDC050363]|uniref:ComF family protein n=1 Tax=Phytomonospora sp. NPDC050363 TaxID=3155642 RepID=UPI0033F6F046
MPLIDSGPLRAVTELVLPLSCAGCGGSLRHPRPGMCGSCLLTLELKDPGPSPPDPPPPGMPLCFAGGPYAGTLREAILAYKERGRHDLRRPLADLLARTVIALPGTGSPVLVPVPSTRAARRRRGCDHIGPLAEAAARLAGGTVVPCLRARRRPDSVGRDRRARLSSAEGAFTPRFGRWPREGTAVVIVDDVMTSGATLSAVAGVLRDMGLRPAGAAVLAAAGRHAK